MKKINIKTVIKLTDIPNVGKAIADDLVRIAIKEPKQLVGKDPYLLYKKLCSSSGKKHDPCVIDVFLSAVHFMETGKTVSWWSFTEERKKYIEKNPGII